MASPKTINSPESYKSYLMEIFAVLVNNQGCRLDEAKDPYEVAKKWGRNQEARNDIEKARNLLLATRLFISKAVDDTWNK